MYFHIYKGDELIDVMFINNVTQDTIDAEVEELMSRFGEDSKIVISENRENPTSKKRKTKKKSKELSLNT